MGGQNRPPSFGQGLYHPNRNAGLDNLRRMSIAQQDADAKRKMEEANAAAQQSFLAQKSYQQGIDSSKAAIYKNSNPDAAMVKASASPNLPTTPQPKPLPVNAATASSANQFTLPNTSGITFGGY